MKTTDFLENYGWVAVGSLTGMALGGASNYSRGLSFLSRDKSSCVEPISQFSLLKIVNMIRENDLSRIRRYPLSPTLFNWHYPMIHVAPLLGFAVYNTFTKKEIDQKGLEKSFLNRAWYQISQSIICPCIDTKIIFAPSLILRDALRRHGIPGTGVDISGHAVIQCSLNIHAIHFLKALEKTGTPIQKKAYSAICTIIAISDAVWMFNTTANYHSIADIACAVAIVVITHLGVEAAKVGLLKGAYIVSQVWKQFLWLFQMLIDRVFLHLISNPYRFAPGKDFKVVGL